MTVGFVVVAVLDLLKPPATLRALAKKSAFSSASNPFD